MPFFQSIPQTLLPPPLRHRNLLLSTVCYPAGNGGVAIAAQHAAKQPLRQMTFGQQEPAIARMFDLMVYCDSSSNDLT
jgi:hypothetical protein